MSPSRNRSRTISVQVPADASAGDTLSFAVGDDQLELVLPDGCQPNDILQIQLEAGEQNDDDEEDEGATTVTTVHEEEKQEEEDESQENSPFAIAAEGENDDHQSDVGGKIGDHANAAAFQGNSSASLTTKTTTATKTSIVLSNKTVITFVHSISAPFSDSACDGTHQMVWPTTRLVTEQESLIPWILASSSSDDSKTQEEKMASVQVFPYHSILELGAGLGCLGLALASELASSPLVVPSSCEKQPNDGPPISLTLTDCAAALPLLVANVDQNRSIVLSNSKSNRNNNGAVMVAIDSQVLDWNDFLPENKKSKHNKQGEVRKAELKSCYDLIVGSDLLYNVAQIPALVHVVNELLSKEGGVMLLLVRWRKPDLERSFFALTSHQCNIQWTLMPSLLFPCTLDWMEVGDPSCERSNRYFGGGVQVSVAGSTPRVLSEITEEYTSIMTTSEHNAWESAHTQIYRGQRRPQEASTSSIVARTTDTLVPTPLVRDEGQNEPTVELASKRQRLD